MSPPTVLNSPSFRVRSRTGIIRIWIGTKLPATKVARTAAALERIGRQSETCHGGKNDRTEHRRERDEATVPCVVEHRRIDEHGPVVLERGEVVRPPPVIALHQLIGGADRGE